MSAGAGFTQKGPSVEVICGNTPQPSIASALHFGFSSAALVPIPAPFGGVPTPLAFTTGGCEVCATAGTANAEPVTTSTATARNQ